jgi:hypothetical protein
LLISRSFHLLSQSLKLMVLSDHGLQMIKSSFVIEELNNYCFGDFGAQLFQIHTFVYVKIQLELTELLEFIIWNFELLLQIFEEINWITYFFWKDLDLIQNPDLWEFQRKNESILDGGYRSFIKYPLWSFLRAALANFNTSHIGNCMDLSLSLLFLFILWWCTSLITFISLRSLYFIMILRR